MREEDSKRKQRRAKGSKLCQPFLFNKGRATDSKGEQMKENYNTQKQKRAKESKEEQRTANQHKREQSKAKESKREQKRAKESKGQ